MSSGKGTSKVEYTGSKILPMHEELMGDQNLPTVDTEMHTVQLQADDFLIKKVACSLRQISGFSAVWTFWGQMTLIIKLSISRLSCHVELTGEQWLKSLPKPVHLHEVIWCGAFCVE